METTRVDGVKRRRVADLVVDVHAPHLRRDAISLFRGDFFLLVGLLDGAPYLLDAYMTVLAGYICMMSIVCRTRDSSVHLSITPVLGVLRQG